MQKLYILYILSFLKKQFRNVQSFSTTSIQQKFVIFLRTNRKLAIFCKTSLPNIFSARSAVAHIWNYFQILWIFSSSQKNGSNIVWSSNNQIQSQNRCVWPNINKTSIRLLCFCQTVHNMLIIWASYLLCFVKLLISPLFCDERVRRRRGGKNKGLEAILLLSPSLTHSLHGVHIYSD